MKCASIEVLKRCPNNCLHCSSDSGLQSDCNKYIISYEKIKKVFDGLSELKTKEVSISGGEPFLHDNIEDIVKYGKEKGFKIYIYTSGIMLDKEGKYIALDKKMIKKLSDIGIDKLIFNLQSLKEDTYNKIMGTKGNLPLLKESIKISKDNGIYTELHFVPMKLNYKEIDDVVKFVESGKADRVSFLGLIPHGRARKNMKELYLDKETNLMVKKLLDGYKNDKVRVGTPLQIKQNKCICDAVSDKLYIKYDGTVHGCEAFKYYKLKDENGHQIEPDSIMDNDDIKHIYDNSKYLKAALKEKDILFKSNVYENCPIQEECRERGIDVFYEKGE